MFINAIDDLQYLFESIGQDILINDIEQKAIITNSVLSEFEERYIHTLQPIKMGDIINFNNENYLVITETINQRYGKYKAKMRHCNFMIEFPGEVEWVPLTDENGNVIYDDLTGEPIFIEVEGDPIFIPAIVDSKTFSIDGEQILIQDNKINITIQDNETNREKFDINSEFELMNKNWKITNQDFTKKGLIIATSTRV